jgi:hypothetical protein
LTGKLVSRAKVEVQREAPVFVQFANFAIASDESISGTGEAELYWLAADRPSRPVH